MKQNLSWTMAHLIIINLIIPTMPKDTLTVRGLATDAKKWTRTASQQ